MTHFDRAAHCAEVFRFCESVVIGQHLAAARKPSLDRSLPEVAGAARDKS